MKNTRRDFLKQSGSCALGMLSLATQMHHFGSISAMAQKVLDSEPDGGANYKALVLIFLQGGNDGNNMIIPIHLDANVSNYNAYSASRIPQPNGLAFSQTQLQNTQVAVPNIAGLTYAMHPNFGLLTQNGTTIVNNGIHELYAQNKLAAVLNVGTLARPMSKAQYQAGTVIKPYQLFSHSDQVNQAQTAISNTQAFTGWGGRLADKLNATNNPAGLVPMVTSIAGAQLFTSGQLSLPMAIGRANFTGTNNLTTILAPAGLTGTNATITARRNAFNSLRGQDLDSNYVAAASHVTDLAMQANGALSTSQDVTTVFPNTSLGLQLKQVARLIKSKDTLNINRQVFYVQTGSFDTHTNQTGPTSSQNSLFIEVSQAMRAFWDELVLQGVQDAVTSFTLSDFARTLQPVGSGVGVVGSDHAWGNHMLVMGGAVNGGNFYGSKRPDGTGDIYPTLGFGSASPDDVDGGSSPKGRWLPTTSVDQYAVRLARWFGLSPADEAAVFPNLQYFNDDHTILNFI